MCEIDQQDKTQKDKKHGSDVGNIVSPEEEKSFRDEEGDDDESEPCQYLRTPKAIL